LSHQLKQCFFLSSCCILSSSILFLSSQNSPFQLTTNKNASLSPSFPFTSFSLSFFLSSPLSFFLFFSFLFISYISLGISFSFISSLCPSICLFTLSLLISFMSVSLFCCSLVSLCLYFSKKYVLFVYLSFSIVNVLLSLSCITIF
jgi:hypothetical protein